MSDDDFKLSPTVEDVVVFVDDDCWFDVCLWNKMRMANATRYSTLIPSWK